MAHDKLIKCKYTGKVLGFKRILKFCKNKKIWVMEEYRFKRKQDIVMCKIQLMYEGEINVLIYKHFSRHYYKSIGQQENDESFLRIIIDWDENNLFEPWNVNNDVYEVDSLTLVNDKDLKTLESGMCIFAYGPEINRKLHEYWMVLEGNVTITSREFGKILGYKRILQIYESEKRRIVCRSGEEIRGKNWIREEFRLAEETNQNHVLCVVKLMDSYKINLLLKRTLGTHYLGEDG